MPRYKPLPADTPTEPIWYLRSLPYGEYRQTNWWRLRRGRYIDSLVAKHGAKRCALCNLERLGDGELTPRFAVHHRSYDHLGYERDQDLVLLCSPCHNLVHFPDSHAARHWLSVVYANFGDASHALAERAADLREELEVAV